MATAIRALLLLALPLGVLACGACSDDRRASTAAAEDGGAEDGGADARPAEVLRRPRVGRRLPEHLARRPRFKRRQQPSGVRCLADGVLGEWRASSVRWLTDGRRVAGAKSWSGKGDLAAKLALVSYGGGLSLAVVAEDDKHVPAGHHAALARSDAVVVELWPTGSGKRPGTALKLSHPAVGVRLVLGTARRLVRFERPANAWREKAVSAFGADVGAGWQLEARIPLSAITPLPLPRIERLRYRVTIRDADEQQRGEATLRFEGTAKLDPPLEVPEAVQRRGSVRICMAAEPTAMWGFLNGWRCSVPYLAPGLDHWALSHARLPEPPRLVYLRERVRLVNFPGLQRGVAGMLDMHKRLVSLLPMGVVGAADPGNARLRNSDAESIRLPDGTWAVVVTHSYPAHHRPLALRRAPTPPLTIPFGARCRDGYSVMLSIIAARGAPHVTPHKEVPPPDPPPRLVEVFRVLLEDCERSRVFEWDLSRDRQRIRVRDLVNPRRPVRSFVFRDGWYQPGASGD